MGTTVIVITHQIDSIIPEITRVVGMRKGGVVVDGAPVEVLNDRVLSDLFQTPLKVLEAGGYRQVLPA
jgi:ABC-type enterochelin transport system, ATPase component